MGSGWDSSQDIHDTLKLLHNTIQTQTKATNRQSTIMIYLTVAILIFTILLFVVAVFQIPKIINNIDTDTHFDQQHRQNYSQKEPVIPIRGK